MKRMVRIILTRIEQPVPSRDTAFEVYIELGIKVVNSTEEKNNFVVDCVDDNELRKNVCW